MNAVGADAGSEAMTPAPSFLKRIFQKSVTVNNLNFFVIL